MSADYSLKRIRWAVSVFYFCQGLVFSSWASRIPDIKANLGMEDGPWGTMLLMISIGQLCGMTISGLLVSKIGSKKILLSMLPFYTLVLIPIALVTNEYLFILVMLLYGVFANFMNISINTQGVNVETLYSKPIMSSFHGAWSIAGFTGSLIGLLMINLNFSTFQHFIIISGVLAVLIFTNYRYLTLDVKKHVSDEERTEKRKHKPEKFLFILGVVAFCGMVTEGTMFDWSGLYFEDIVMTEHTLVPLGFAGFMVMMASGRFVADKCLERWGKKTVIQISGILTSSGVFLAVAFPNIVVATLAFMIVGLGVSCVVPTVYSIAGQKTKISTGLALTVVSSISFMGFLLGPPVIGYISEATSLRHSFAFVGIFGIIITLMVSRLKIFSNT